MGGDNSPPVCLRGSGVKVHIRAPSCVCSPSPVSLFSTCWWAEQPIWLSHGEGAMLSEHSSKAVIHWPTQPPVLPSINEDSPLQCALLLLLTTTCMHCPYCSLSHCTWEGLRLLIGCTSWLQVTKDMLCSSRSYCSSCTTIFLCSV